MKRLLSGWPFWLFGSLSWAILFFMVRIAVQTNHIDRTLAELKAKIVVVEAQNARSKANREAIEVKLESVENIVKKEHEKP